MNLKCVQDLLATPAKKGNSFSEQLPEMYQYAVEEFINDLISNISEKDPNGASSIKPEDIFTYIEGHSEFEFLAEEVEKIRGEMSE